MSKSNKTLELLQSSNLSSSPSWTKSLMRPENVSNSEDEENDSKNEEDSNLKANYQDIANSVIEDETSEFFRPMLVYEQKSRQAALKRIISLLEQSLETEEKSLVESHLSRIVRFTTESPFDDVIEEFKNLLDKIDREGSLLPPRPNPQPSVFISKNHFVPINTDDQVKRKLYIECFLQNGRVSHLDQIICLHPSYFEKYLSVYNLIMRHDGPIPFAWRNYISILTAARFQCKYLVNLQEIEFLLNDGDKNWLRGLEFAPNKILNLMELLQTLCHRPWRISKTQIETLVKGTDSWSIGELVHAMIIIVTAKALASIALGCGVTPEVDFVDLEDWDLEAEDEDDNRSTSSSFLVDTSKILELLQDQKIESSQIEEQESLFGKAETVSEITTDLESADEFIRYTGNYLMRHEDFDVKSKSYKIFRVQDYYWKEHGFELFRRYLPGIAVPLDEEFDHIYNMTYGTFGRSSQKVETGPLRKACWQYIQRVKGMFHDDYNYKEVNEYLDINIKSFLKKITCYPETITLTDFQKAGYDFKAEEKVHIVLLAIQSSRQSELLYGLHAVMRHMHNRES